MKKLLIMMVLVMGAYAVNAQRTPIKVADLPKAITDNVAKDYVGFTIKEATKEVENNVVKYDVVITKGTMQETLSYDAAGKFLKKMEAKSGMAKTGQKPATKPPIKNK
jgi:hypothetical protein